MANINLTFPEAVKERVLHGFCGFHGYQETVIDVDQVTMIPNPETPLAFTKRLLIEYLMDAVRKHEANEAAAIASAAAIDSVNTDIEVN